MLAYRKAKGFIFQSFNYDFNHKGLALIPLAKG